MMSALDLPSREDRLAAPDLKPGQHIHLVGIGGFGLSAIARVLLGREFGVSGSDQQASALTGELAAAGATISIGHRPENVRGADILLVSSAVPDDNPELQAARSAGIPVFKRSTFLHALMTGSYGIAVAGSHGKTTTTGMVAQVLLAAGLDPTVILGGVLPSLGTNGRAGTGDYFVIEADEYDHMFLGLRPTIAVLTNVEHDHPDLFPTDADYQAAFRAFIALLPADGRLVVCADDPGALAQAAATPVTVETYGLGQAEWQALELRTNPLGGTDFLVHHHGRLAGLARLRIPGEHNVRNALAAIAVTTGLEVDFHIIREALGEFGGIGRRFQIVGEVGDVVVIDDYAHHPTEIQATLSAVRQRFPDRRVWAVWQPHTYSRTKALFAGFAASFAEADRMIALDIFQSREQDTLGISAADVVQAMDHPDARHIPRHEAAAAYILDRVRPGDVVVTLTAGDGNRVGALVLDGLSARRPHENGFGPIAKEN